MTEVQKKILDLKTQIITLLEVETMIIEKRAKLEGKCRELEIAIKLNNE